jgi:hypothetical protein
VLFLVLAVALLVSAPAGAEPQSASSWDTDVLHLCGSLMTANEKGELVRSPELEACESAAAARLERRREAAPSLTREELAQIPEEFRIPEERDRIAQFDGRKKRAEREARLQDKRWMRPALSASWCTYAQMRTEALAKRQKQQASDYLRSMKTIAIALKHFATTPNPCSDPLTAQIKSCLISDEARNACSTEILQYVVLAPKIYP